VYILLFIGSLAMLLPLAWLVRSSVMTSRQIFKYPIEWIPQPFAWENYPNATQTVPLFSYLLNTMTILIPAVVGTVVTSCLSAYGFSRLRWPGRNVIFIILLTTLMVPYAITLIPTFLVWSKLKLVNTFWPLIVPSWFGGSIFYVFLLRQFFQTIPLELDDAALIDGANPLQVLWFVIIPLSRPALITVTVFSALWVWNDFMGPLIYLNDEKKYTLAVGLINFVGMYTADWHLLMAASMIAVFPVLILFFVAQRYFIEGITLTGIKA
jgi:multiple sugar transport system permease protein